MAGITRTYWCGIQGIVHRLTNLSGLWNNVSVPNANINLNDIKTDPTNPDKVFAVGNFNTIYVSSNAGASWTLANTGTIAFPSVEWHEVWPIDPLNIVIVGSLGLVAFSTDGGVTFNPATTLFPNTGSVRAVHFLTPLIGVVGYDDKVFRTTDGGVTWISCNSGLGLTSTGPSGSIVIINGIHIDQSQQVIVVHANTNIWRSTDGGLTFGLPVYTYTQTIFIGNQNIFVRNGKHLTWYSDNNLWGIGDYNQITRSSDAGASWTTAALAFPTYSICDAGHFYTTKDGFYSITSKLYSTPDADTNATPVGPIDQYPSPAQAEIPIAAVWTALPGPCYNLIACDGRPIPIIVDNDLSQLVGQVVMVDGQCYIVQLAQSCQGAITITTPITSFPDCCSCNPPTCYELRDCTAQTPVIVTNTNLAQYVGQTIKVCDFLSSPVLPIQHITAPFCNPGETAGYITQITGPTSGFFYEESSGFIIPYSNPTAAVLAVGQPACFTVGSPYVIVPPVGFLQIYLIQFFVGTTAITNPIPVTTSTSQSALQYFINLNIIDSNYTITINYFLPIGLNVNITTTAPITDTTTTTTITPAYNGESSITADIIGGCICYTVFDIGPGCNCTAPFLGTISGVFPDCECCLPQPLAPGPLPYEPTIPEIDKHTYFIRESECDILANQTFANAMYDIFKTEAYGLESCCPRNINQIWIQKELSDLSKINC